MNRLLQLTGAIALACCVSAELSAQVLNPVITGDNMLCPEGTGMLTTGTYDSYQWYQRYYGSNDTMMLAGETSQTLNMDYYNYAASYMIVEVTGSDTTEMSPEFFVDGWAFLPPAVMTSGDFTTGPNGESIICEGDTLYFEMMSPNTTNITWFESGDTIPGETNAVLAVTEAGSYTVSGAPAECPNYIQYMGIPLDVIVENCGSAGLDENALPQAHIYPNPASSELTVEHATERITAVQVHNQLGQFVQEVPANALAVTFSVAQLEKGLYFVTINYGSGSEVRTVAIR